jgi:hypothetical protein
VAIEDRTDARAVYDLMWSRHQEAEAIAVQIMQEAFTPQYRQMAEEFIKQQEKEEVRQWQKKEGEMAKFKTIDYVAWMRRQEYSDEEIRQLLEKELTQKEEIFRDEASSHQP